MTCIVAFATRKVGLLAGDDRSDWDNKRIRKVEICPDGRFAYAGAGVDTVHMAAKAVLACNFDEATGQRIAPASVAQLVDLIGTVLPGYAAQAIQGLRDRVARGERTEDNLAEIVTMKSDLVVLCRSPEGPTLTRVSYGPILADPSLAGSPDVHRLPLGHVYTFGYGGFRKYKRVDEVAPMHVAQEAIAFVRAHARANGHARMVGDLGVAAIAKRGAMKLVEASTVAE